MTTKMTMAEIGMSDALREWLESIDRTPPEFGVGIDPPTPMQTPAGRKVLFPFPSTRAGQLDVVDRVASVLNSGKDVLLCAGTGFGKSPTMMALASLFKDAWLLVGKNDLVEQWKNDFQRLDHCGFYKSRNSFRCHLVPGKTCGEANRTCLSSRKALSQYVAGGLKTPPVFLIAPSDFNDYVRQYGEKSAEVHFKKIARDFMQGKNCMYERNRDYALSKDITISTVAMALTIFSYLGYFPPVRKRKLMVIDECSEIESELLRFYEMQVSTKTITNLVGSAEVFVPDQNGKILCPPPKTTHEALVWVNNVDDFIDRKKKEMEIAGVEFTDDDCEVFDSFKNKLKAIASGLKMKVPFFAEIEQTGWFNGRGGQQMHDSYIVHIKPLEARGLFDQTLGQFAEHFIFTSATTGTAELFNATLGRTRPLEYVEVLSTFPVANRPIYVVPSANMSFKTIDGDLPKMTQAVMMVANSEDHRNQKGIIHTFTNRITDAVVKSFIDAGLQRRIIVLKGSGPTRNDQMKIFRMSPDPMILVSPSAMMGISLDDDLGRWQIIAKVPFPNFKDKSIEYRKDNIDGWYAWQTSKDMIQTFGRIIRSPTDWGTTYILDSCFINHYYHNELQFPGFIRDAIHIVKR